MDPLELKELLCQKTIFVWDTKYNVKFLGLTEEMRTVYRALLVEAKHSLRVLEGRFKIKKTEAFSTLLAHKKDSPEWKLKLQFEKSIEFAKYSNELNTAHYAVEVLEAVLSVPISA